jgi:hypothetical protein
VGPSLVEADPPKSAPFSLFSLSDSLSHVLSSPSIESQIKRKKQIVKKKKKGGKRKEKREREREGDKMDDTCNKNFSDK